MSGSPGSPDVLGSDDTRPAWEARLPFHYGWVIVAVGAVVSMAVLGMGRFAFGMVLPSMRDGLGFSYGDAGWIGTCNFLGYLAGASRAGAVAKRLGPRSTVTVGLALVALSLALVTFASALWAVIVLFALTGLGSGVANVTMVAMTGMWFLKSMRGWASGLVVGGIGLGLMGSGLVVPAVNRMIGPGDGWRLSWRIMAGSIAVVGVVAAVLLRDGPQYVGIKAAGHPVRDAVEPAPVSQAEQRRTTLTLGLVYSMYGFAYAIFVTFIVTTLVEQRGLAESAAGWIWFVIGLLSLACGFFGKLSDRVGRKRGLAIVFAMHAVAYLIVGLQLPGVLLYAAVALFGIAAWSVPGIMGAVVGDYLPPAQAVHALGALTIFFGIGQAAGPALAGVIGQHTGEFTSAYLLAALAALIGATGSLLMRQPGGDTARA
ncbi:MAG: YbfB/YjiJ family MFS transporter [Actinomycetales bacterium]|nr:YbfB/YjiJ family MFS transporter [Actinomycetales bacterium]